MVSLSSLQMALDKLAAAVRRVESQRAVSWCEGATVDTAGAIPTVVLDSDASVTPRPVSANWAGVLEVGQRVRVEHVGARLTVVAAVPAPAAAPVVARTLTKDDTQSIATATNTLVAGWDSDADDPGDTAGGITYSGGRFTVPEAGAYRIAMGAAWASSTAGYRQFSAYRGGVELRATRAYPSSSGACEPWFADVIECAAGDVIDIRVRQNTGSSLAVGGNATLTWYTCTKIN